MCLITIMTYINLFFLGKCNARGFPWRSWCYIPLEQISLLGGSYFLIFLWLDQVYIFHLNIFFLLILEKFCVSNFNYNLCPFRAQKGILYFLSSDFAFCSFYQKYKCYFLSLISCVIAAFLEKLLACSTMFSYSA